MKKALLIYDRTGRYASPPDAVADILQDLFDGMYVLDCTHEYASLSVGQLRQYHMLILAAADWEHSGSKASAAALIQYVVSGGAVLAVGDFLKVSSCFELECLFGKRWIGESTPCLLDFSAAGTHPITEQTNPFSLVEYANFYELDPFLQPQTVLHLTYASKQYPAAWCHSYGWGKVFCITAGNIPESYLPPLRRIFWRCGEWFLNRL